MARCRHRSTVKRLLGLQAGDAVFVDFGYARQAVDRFHHAGHGSLHLGRKGLVAFDAGFVAFGVDLVALGEDCEGR